VLKEFELAYNLGDPDAARKFLKMGKLKTTKYVVKFDILKTSRSPPRSQASTAARWARWPACSARSRLARRARAGAVGGTAWAQCTRSEATSVWVIGMRYKIINAETTSRSHRLHRGKMEVGASSSGVARRVAIAAGRRVARHDGAAARAEVGLGNRRKYK
jgi:hypothetical protein